MLHETERMVTVPRPRRQAPEATLGWAMDVRLDAHPGSLRIARKIAATAARAAGATQTAAFELETALGEALTNAFLHAYGADPGGRIALHLRFREGSIQITIRDDGRALDAAPAVPADVAPDLPAGRGLFIMSRLMDRVEVIHPDRRGRGTAVRMSKRLGRSDRSRRGRERPVP